MRPWIRIVAPVLLLSIGLAAPATSEDDEPISVPFEDMTDDEWEAREARNQAYAVAVAQWDAYYYLVCAMNVAHEAELQVWRAAMDQFLLDPSLPSPGDRPELHMPARPSVAQPGAYEPPNC